MKPPQARVYLEGVVLGLVRADLEQPSTRKDTRKLNPHLYEALKRSLYKPAAFFKAIVFPLLDVSGLDGSIFSDIGGHLTLCVLGRVYTQGGRDRRVRTCQSQSAAFAFLSCAHPPRGDGLLRYATHLSFLLLPHMTHVRTCAR